MGEGFGGLFKKRLFGREKFPTSKGPFLRVSTVRIGIFWDIMGLEVLVLPKNSSYLTTHYKPKQVCNSMTLHISLGPLKVTLLTSSHLPLEGVVPKEGLRFTSLTSLAPLPDLQ